MDDRKLVEENVKARMLKKRTLLIALLIPIPFVFLLIMIRDRSLTHTLIYGIIVLPLGLLLARRVFWEIERITTTELEYRSFKKRVNTSEAQSEKEKKP